MQTELFLEGEMATQVELLERTVSSIGMEDCISGEREATHNPTVKAPLFADPAIAITNETKEEFVVRFLQHKLVLCIRQQAAAFREVHICARARMHAHAHTAAFCVSLTKCTMLHGAHCALPFVVLASLPLV